MNSIQCFRLALNNIIDISCKLHAVPNYNPDLFSHFTGNCSSAIVVKNVIT